MYRPLQSTFIFGAALLLTACGGGGSTSPTAPTASPDTTASTSTSSTMAAPTTATASKVAGWIKAFGTGAGVENASVLIGNTASATTNAEGYFELDVSQSGTLPVAIEASGFHKSESYLDVNASKSSTQNGVTAVYAYRDILPSNNDSVFDMNF